jgi:large subunit ribosomal protein L20
LAPIFFTLNIELTASTALTSSSPNKQHKALLKHAKGYRGRSKNCFSIAVRRVEKGWEYAYRDRRRKKREWRKLWIMRLQAGVRQYNWRYSAFIPALTQSNIQLNRKVLAELAANEPFAFRSVVSVVEHETGIQNSTALIGENN